jgi:DNA-binding transcriptional ArsR family regulator
MQETKLQKTALSNHLIQLIDKGLVERFERGQYRITEDGQEFLEAAATTYQASLYREQARQEQIRRQRESSLRLRAEKMDEKAVSNEPVYQPCWISYLGAVSGVLKSLGKDHDIIDVGGFTGYAFWTCAAKEMIDPSGPTAYGKDVRNEIHTKGMEGLGVKSRWIDREEGGLPVGDFLPPHDRRALNLFNRVKEEIRKDNSVILWGIPVPEWGIAKGYRGQSYLVSTFRHLENIPEDPIKYNEIQSPGMIAAQILEPIEGELAEEHIDKKAIERAIRIAEGPLPEWLAEMCVAGPSAYRTWATHLEQKATRSYMGNSYVAACYQEGRAVAAEFLSRLVKNCEGKHQAEGLSQASTAYQRAAELLQQFTELFPFAFEGELPEEKCKEGAKILLSVEKAELAGIEQLKAALKAWE